jgi:hypothetical protein
MKRSIWVSLLALVSSLAVVGAVMAVHPPGGVVVSELARGTLADAVQSHNLGQGGINVKTRGPVDVVTAQVTFVKGGGSAGWHTHPGPVFVVMRTGTLSVWDEHCMKSTYSAGPPSAPGLPPGAVLFEIGPGHSMLVKNESATVDATLYATFIVPVGATPLTITTEHRCGIAG